MSPPKFSALLGRQHGVPSIPRIDSHESNGIGKQRAKPRCQAPTAHNIFGVFGGCCAGCGLPFGWVHDFRNPPGAEWQCLSWFCTHLLLVILHSIVGLFSQTQKILSARSSG
eukprot:s179_g3.t1